MKRTTNTEGFTKQLDALSAKVEKLQDSATESDAKIRLLEQQAKIIKWIAATVFGAIIVALVGILIK